ncbi:MAG: PilT/PilU family type 4a pilus ATPase [bacterium]|nr:PilT/PilU family type 4a pilus ATPase [bacterium]
MNYELELDDLLSTVIKQNASDLHLTVGRHPSLRIDGVLYAISKKDFSTAEYTRGIVGIMLSKEQSEQLARDKEMDMSFDYKEKARFRVNVFFQRGFLSVAMRLIPTKIRTMEELSLPPIVREFVKPSQGFVLVAGPTGHGKSTTLAAIIDEINHTRADHIITIEDPIEYIFSPDRAIIDQREVYHDSLSFHRALRSVFRQDADVVMIGEMRDPETIAAAVTAAETGHLIFSTLHTNSAAQTIDRIIDSFPPQAQGQIKSQLSSSLLGIISQRLIPRIGGGVIPAVELMVANSAIRTLIREGKTHQLDLVIETSADEGMISLNKSLSTLVHTGAIAFEDAEAYSQNPQELHMMLKSSLK